jgi:hypothetical protein
MFFSELAQLWEYWKWKMTSAVPMSSPASFRKISYPGDGFTRQEVLESLEWRDGKLPPLDMKGWHKKKFTVRETGATYRMQILWLRFVRNSSTKLVRVEFEYNVQVYNPYLDKWICG